MFKIALTGGPLNGHRFEVPQLDGVFVLGQPAWAETALKPGERGRQIAEGEYAPMTEAETNPVGTYSKTKRTVSGRTVYQWNEPGV